MYVCVSSFSLFIALFNSLTTLVAFLSSWSWRRNQLGFGPYHQWVCRVIVEHLLIIIHPKKIHYCNEIQWILAYLALALAIFLAPYFECNFSPIMRVKTNLSKASFILEACRWLLLADDGRLSVREDHLDVRAVSTLDVHEVWVGSLTSLLNLFLSFSSS